MTKAILLVDDNVGHLNVLAFTLSDHGYDEEHGFRVLQATDGERALQAVEKERDNLALILSDLKMPGRLSGIEFLQRTLTLAPRAIRILITAYAGEITLKQAVNAGQIYAFFEKGYSTAELLEAVRAGLAQNEEWNRVIRENAQMRERLAGGETLKEIVGASPAVQLLKSEIVRVASVDSTVLITGETGTGKELTARAIHNLSAYRNGPFLGLNCAAIPEGLLESELFGSVRGAFSDARDRSGLIEAAVDGTLFLDEIGKTGHAFQTKLLRFLDTAKLRPVGSNVEKVISTRIIAAANENLGERAEHGEFLRDLLYRLRQVRIDIAPLRQRQGDIELLARHFLDSFNREYARVVLGFTPAALAKLTAHPWPGNVRELREVIREAVIKQVEDGAFIDADNLEPAGDAGGRVPERAEGLDGFVERLLAEGKGWGEIREVVEKRVLEFALERASWVIEAVARELGVSRPWIYDRLERYGLKRKGKGREGDAT